MANFNDDKIKTVWENAISVDNYDNKKFRKDICGAWMAWLLYGRECSYGWEIDHALPESKGGTDHLDNLRAMNWANNRSKADDFPTYKTAITSDSEKNVKSEKQLTINDFTLKRLTEIYPNSQYLQTIKN